MRARLLFDIDGVLNPFFTDRTRREGFELFRTPYSSWVINRKEHGKWLRHIAHNADFWWASMWQADSNPLAAEYHLANSSYPHVEFLDWYPLDNNTYKLPSVRYLLGKRTPAVWLDDELRHDAYEWADARGRTLLISCNPAHGWVKAEYETVVFFIDHLRALTRLRAPLESKVVTRLHDVRSLAKVGECEDLFLVRGDKSAGLTFATSNLDVCRTRLRPALEMLLGVEVRLIAKSAAAKRALVPLLLHD